MKAFGQELWIICLKTYLCIIVWMVCVYKCVGGECVFALFEGEDLFVAIYSPPCFYIFVFAYYYCDDFYYYTILASPSAIILIIVIIVVGIIYTIIINIGNIVYIFYIIIVVVLIQYVICQYHLYILLSF